MIFVTGGTGLVGNCVIRELVCRGLPVRALCRKGTPRKCFDGLSIEIIEGDLNDTAVLRNAIAGCTAVIHSAALIHIGWKRLEESRNANVVGTQNIVAACIEHGARLIYVSTVDTLPAAISMDSPIDESGSGGVAKTPCTYVISKREAEQVVGKAVQDQKLDAVVIHPGFMLAPFDWKPSSGRMMLEVTKAPVALAPSGGCSFCDARDVAHGIVNAIDQGNAGDSYILGGVNLTYQDLWTRMLRTAGKNRRVHTARPFLNVVARLFNALGPLIPIREGDINGAAIEMGQLFHYYSSAKAERELGYTRRPIDETLSEAWEWLQQLKYR
jgi:dihydroflavonol-4-reductase